MRREAVILALVLLGLSCGSPKAIAQGRTYYVDPAGSDASGDGSEAHPWLTIQHAADQVAAGDTVLINPGIYQGGITVDRGGTATDPITFRAHAQGVVVGGSGGERDAFFITYADYVVVEGLTIRQADRAGMRVDHADHVTIRDCTFADNTTWGVFTDFSDYLLIEGNEAYGSVEEHGIYVSNSGDYPTIRRNRVHDNYACGIHMNGDASMGGDGVISHGVVEANVVYSNGLGGGAAINMDGVADTIVRNNLLYANHAGGIAVFQQDGAVGSRNNRLLNNTIIMPEDGRWAVNISQPGCVNNWVFNNIIYSYHNWRGCIVIPSAGLSGFQSDYNVVMDRFSADDDHSVITLSEWRTLGYDLHSLIAEPAALLVNPSGQDYHLRAGSPAIDAGMALSEVSEDLEGRARPWGAAFDIGAFEYVAMPPLHLPLILKGWIASVVPTPTPVAAPTSTPTAEPAVDKWTLWTGGTRLRGANIYQRRVYPELDGTDFMGPGPLGPPYVQSDLDRLAAMGANYVNVSHPGLFTEAPPYVLDEDAQDNLDSLLSMIAEAHMFAVISFRSGPGRSEFTFLLEDLGDWFDASYLNDSMWQDQAAQDAWVEMWRYTAERYRDNLIVVGYDLMVEPNSNEVGSDAITDRLDIWDPEEFYVRYGGTLYDWNQLYPRITSAIRQVDTDTPILIGGNGYSAVEWLPYLEPTGDSRTVYTIHQYAPSAYTHQEPPLTNTYPGVFDTDWDGDDDQFNRAWLEGLLSTVDGFVAANHVPVAVNEFGAMRWEPGVDDFMDDQMALFEQRGMNYALWLWETSWPPYAADVDAFNFRHGPDPHNHTDVGSSDLMDVITTCWGRNTATP